MGILVIVISALITATIQYCVYKLLDDLIEKRKASKKLEEFYNQRIQKDMILKTN